MVALAKQSKSSEGDNPGGIICHMDDSSRPRPSGHRRKNKVWNLMAISRYSENYCYDVIYDYNSFSQMSQDEMTIIILFRLDTILDGKFKPNSFNASWFQGEGFYCFL